MCYLLEVGGGQPLRVTGEVPPTWHDGVST